MYMYKCKSEYQEKQELEEILISGKKFEDGGQIELAIENYEKALTLGEKLNDEDQITNVYILLGNCYNLTNKVQKAIESCEKSLEIAKEKSDKLKEADAYLVLGNTYTINKEYEKAIRYCEKASDIAKQQADKRRETDAYIGLGNSYRFKLQNQTAIECYKEALEIAKERTDKRQETEAYIGLGHANRGQERYQTAIECYKRALEIAKMQADKTQETDINIALGDVCRFTKQCQTAIEYYEKALKVAKTQDDKGRETKAYIGLGKSYRENNQYQTAIEYYEKALEIAKKQDNKEGERKAYFGLGNAYECNDQYQTAIEYYEKVLEIAKVVSNKDSQMDMLQSLGDIHVLNGQNEKALNYWEKALKLAEEEGYEIARAKILKNLEEFKKREGRTSSTNIKDSKESWKWKESSKVHRGKFEKLLEFGKQHPSEVKVINGVRVCCSNEFCIGMGADGTRVYVGLGQDGLERAVKRLPKDICTEVAEQEMKVLTEPNTINSNNVVKYWFLDENSDKEYLFLILDLCEETLESYVDRKSRDDLPIIAPVIIRQVLKGLADLHRSPKPILHRDLKPSNILRDVNNKWLLADFGISRVMKTDKTTHKSKQRGSRHWRAFETYPTEDTSDDGEARCKPDDCQVRYKKESDIQVAGMVAYYIVTKGEHPFGKERNLLDNLLDGKPVGLEKLKDPALKDFLTWMLSHDPKDRPSAEEALKHPYLQTKEQQFELLCNMGNQPEIKNELVSSIVVQQLNSDSTDWQTQMDADVLKYLCTGFLNGKPTTFKYTSSWASCLRLIRNVNQHWNDRPRPKPQPEAFYLVGDPQEYFLKIFPDLPVTVHRAVRSCDWKERPELQKYFKLEEV